MNDLPRADTTAPPETAPGDDLEDLENWSNQELQAAILQWYKPADPNGPITNAPDAHSSTMPSPDAVEKINRAKMIILARGYIDAPPPPRGKRMYYSVYSV